MRILVSNDDGIHAPGIRTLAETLATRHTVHVVAPDRERSATGHALTLHKPLRVDTHEFEGVAGAWSVNGTPSDCVKLGIWALVPEPPDIVISGINRGPNLGMDIIYSGTVSAAVEGSMMGYPALAVSSAAFDDKHYDTAARVVLELLDQVMAHPLPARTLYNVNVPSLPFAELAGVAVTKLGVRRYTDVFESRVDLRGRTYYWLAGEVIEKDEAPDSDVVAVRQNKVAITPVHYDLTSYPLLQDLQAWGQQASDTLGGIQAKEG